MGNAEEKKRNLKFLLEIEMALSEIDDGIHRLQELLKELKKKNVL